MSVTPEPQQTIALVVRHNTAGIDEHVQAIVDFLQGAGYRVVFEQETSARTAAPPSSSAATARCWASPASWRATACRSSASTRAAWAS
jgi:hypothetical protein